VPTDALLFLLASDWFVLHAGALGLLPGLDADDVEAVSVAARTPIQGLMAQVENYLDADVSPARIDASAEEFLARCRPEVRRYDEVAALVGRWRALDAADFAALSAWWRVLRVDGNARLVSTALSEWRAAMEARVAGGRAEFTSWDESLDVFRPMASGDSALLVDVAAVFVPWVAMRSVLSEGGLNAEAWAALEASAARLGVPEHARAFARVGAKVAG
jgi:hypothetical protein